MSNLYKASNQWCNRPQDERYWDLEEALQEARATRQASREASIDLSTLRAESIDGDLFFRGRKDRPVRATFRGFGGLCRRVGEMAEMSIPANYLRQLPATLAAQNLNYGLGKIAEGSEGKLLLLQNGEWALRDVTSPGYVRVYHDEVLEQLISLRDRYGLKTPPGRAASDSLRTRLATEKDVLQGHAGGKQVRVGDQIQPSGVYLGQSDPELFVVLVSDRTVSDGQSDLFRGIIIESTEVSGRCYRATTFLFRGICGNHIIWGAEQVESKKVRHFGAKAREQILDQDDSDTRIVQYLDSSADIMTNRIQTAQRLVLGTGKEETVEKLYAKRLGTQKVLTAAWDSTAQNSPVDGDPNTAWGMVQGLTRLSQDTQWADQRFALDKAASKVLALAN